MQQYPHAKTQVKLPVLLFLKLVGPPIVLYFENPEEVYNELIEIMNSANDKAPKLIEKKANGPVKNIAFLDTQIASVALQEETHVSY